MSATSLGRLSIFPSHTGSQMASAQGIQPATPLDEALHQFGARLFEAAPGLITWILLLAPAWIPIIFPWPGAFVVAGVVLLFDIYWLLRSITVVMGVYSTLSRMRRDMRKDWLAICYKAQVEGLRDPLQYIHPCLIPTHTHTYSVLVTTDQC